MTSAGMKNRLPVYGRFLTGLRRYLDTPISYAAARATILRRTTQRNENFLRMVRRCIYDNPASPYLPLLRDAGCSYGDMVSALAQTELESLLVRLRESGVWISFEEYKGRKPVARGGRTYPTAEASFDNPLVASGWEARTGGSTGRPSRMLLDLEFLADRACYEHFVFRLLDICGLPFALWYPKLPASIGLSSSLRYAKIGQPPERWFDMQLAGQSTPRWHGFALSLIIALSRLSTGPIPRPTPAPLSDPSPVLDWIAEAIRRKGRCVVQSNVSGVVRICRAAAARGMELHKVQFITGSEPLTPSKFAEIDALHAPVYLRYYAVDLGTIALGCGFPAVPDEMHLASDSVALVGEDGSAPEGVPQRLFLTSILGRGPKVVLNLEIGDQAIVARRRCACLYDELGFHTHLSCVRGSAKSTAEGIALPYASLAHISEEVLPGRFGGSPLDYQWVEDEDDQAGGLTRMWLRVAPGLGTIDAGELITAILAEIAKIDGAHRFCSQLWSSAKTIRILREDPQPTPGGKTHAVVRGRAAGIASGPARHS